MKCNFIRRTDEEGACLRHGGTPLPRAFEAFINFRFSAEGQPAEAGGFVRVETDIEASDMVTYFKGLGASVSVEPVRRYFIESG